MILHHYKKTGMDFIPAWKMYTYTPFTRKKNYTDRDLDTNLDWDRDYDTGDVSVYTGPLQCEPTLIR